MKIGIITLHYALNAGAVLQAFALQTYLKSLGHEVEFIDYVPKHQYSLRSFIAKSPYVMYNISTTCSSICRRERATSR